MDIDAFSTHNKPIFDQIRAICRERRLCFRCLQPLTPPDHTGSVNCPNPRMTTEQRKLAIAKFKSSAVAPVATIETSLPSLPSNLSVPQAKSPAEALDPHASYLGYDEFDFDDTDPYLGVPVATVQVRLNSQERRVFVPLTIRPQSGGAFVVNALVDSGAMANLMDERFTRENDLRLFQRKVPIQCIGFQGRREVGGLITQGWSGRVQLTDTQQNPFDLKCSFGITRLGSVDAILGKPWLDQQGWTVSGNQEGHSLSIGSKPVHVMETSIDTGVDPEG